MQLKSFICTGVACVLLTGCETGQGPIRPEPPAVPVVAAPPTVQDITIYVDSVGTLLAAASVEIRPQTSGMIKEVLVDEGQWVEKGTPLFVIDEMPNLTKVQEAEAQHASDEASLAVVQKKIARLRSLVDKDYISKTEWEELEAQEEKAMAALQLDKARLTYANIELAHCTVRSPLTGRVGAINGSVGQIVAAGQPEPLTTVANMDPLTVEFTLTEKEFALIPKEKLTMEVQATCSKEPCKQGTVDFVDNEFDPKTGLLLVHGTLANPDYVLRPGQTVHVRVPVAFENDVLVIPQKAIRYNQQGPFVYVVKPDMSVTVRQVKLGAERGFDQIILDGIESDEPVIHDGHLRLSEGLKVELK